MSNNVLKADRLTTEYVQHEDRIRLNLEDAQQQRATLWFTQRLLNRVIPALVKVLEEETSGSPQAEEVQAFAQQRAQRSIEQEAPIAATDAAWLVRRVDLTPTKQQILLLFSDEAEESAKLKIPRTALRQWLSVLRELYRRAEWSSDIWPDWLAPLSQTDETVKTKLH
ncbi:MAG TPA: hypothetical protein VLA39_01050 [Marinobacterium sp.]|nr:hypothetical protein [Marinobacterium sp.]